MKIPHTSPREFNAGLNQCQVLLIFKGKQGAEAFDEWFEFAGGSEAFAAWVQEQQVRDGKFPGLEIQDSEIISWEKEE